MEIFVIISFILTVQNYITIYGQHLNDNTLPGEVLQKLHQVHTNIHYSTEKD